jgi:uncharacterized protein
MRLVIDTNVFVASLSSHSMFHWLIDALIDEKFDLFISNEVVLEYEEILKRKYPYTVAENFIRSLNELPNVQKIEVHYQWNIIYADPDDNKFVDLAIAANADFIISNDKHFNILNQTDFPKVGVLKLQELMLHLPLK